MSAAPAPASDTPSVAVCAPQVVYLAIVDTLTSDVVLEHVKTALRNAVHRLPDGASFGSFKPYTSYVVLMWTCGHQA